MTGAPSSEPRRRGRRFARDESGLAVLEFAYVGPLLLMLFFAAIEFSLLALKISMLDGAMATVSRSIYTGDPVSRDELEEDICSQLLLISDCAENVRIEATELTTFAATPPDDSVECVDSDQSEFQPASTFETGGGGSIVLLRVCVTTDLILPFWSLGSFLNKTDGGRYQIVSSLAFRNEPF